MKRLLGTTVFLSTSLAYHSFAQENIAVDSLGNASETTSGVEIEIPVEGENPTLEEAPPVDELPPLEKMPELVEFIQAEYSANAVKAGVEGDVLFTMLINESGVVESIRLDQGIHPDLDSAALKAVKQFRFSPAQAGGENVAVEMQYAYRFVLDKVLPELSQQVNLRGILKTRGTRSPVAEAIVVLEFQDSSFVKDLPMPLDKYLEKLGEMEGQTVEEGKVIVHSDVEGAFQFRGLPNAKVKLSFLASGYQASQISEEVKSDQEVKVEYKISKESYNNYEIVIHGEAIKKEVSKKQLKVSEIKRIPGVGGDAVKVVTVMPGVTRPNFISGDIMMRGAGAEDNAFLLDGVTIPLVYHFGGLKSVVHSDLLSAVDLYQGGFGPDYKNAVGGVIELKGRPAKMDRWHGIVDANVFDANLMFEGPVTDRIGLQVAGRYSYIGPVIEEMTKDMSLSVVPYYWDGMIRSDFAQSENHNYFVTLHTSKDRMDMIGNSVKGGSEEVSKNTSAAGYSAFSTISVLGANNKFSDKLAHETRIGIGRYEENTNIFGAFKTNYVSKFLSSKNKLTWTPSEYLSWSLSSDLEIRDLDYDLHIMSSTGPKKHKSAQNASIYGGFSQLDITPFKGLLIQPGVRYDYYKMVNEGDPSYRLTTRWQYADNLTLKAAGGMYNQNPVPYAQATDTVWGNPELPLIKATHMVLGHEWKINDLLSLDIQGYYNQMKNIPRESTKLNEKTHDPINFEADMDGRTYGMEVLFRHNQSEHFFGWIAYTLARSERRSPESHIEEFNPDFFKWDPKAWVLFEKDQTHNLQVVGSWKLPNNWEAGFRFQYTTGDPTTPILGMTEKKFEYNSDNGEYSQLKGKPFSDRVDSFVQLDIRVDKKWIFDNWILGAYFDLRNATYPVYNSPEDYDYNYDFSERKTIGALMLPALGIEASF